MSFTWLYTLSDLISNPAEHVKTEVLEVISRDSCRVSDVLFCPQAEGRSDYGH